MNRYKMYRLFLLLVVLTAQSMVSFAQNGSTKKYKCMVQMTNYMGEGAYIVISLVDNKGVYDKTLYVMGSDKKWYKNLKEWQMSYAKKPANLSAITGASVSGGDRSVNVLEIEDSKINKGYTLRFESAVEDNKYYVKDLEFPLTTEKMSSKVDGTGYIRYVRLIPN